MQNATQQIIKQSLYLLWKKRKSVQVNQRLTVKPTKVFAGIAPFFKKQGAYALVYSFNSLDKKGQNSNV